MTKIKVLLAIVFMVFLVITTDATKKRKKKKGLGEKPNIIVVSQPVMPYGHTHGHGQHPHHMMGHGHHPPTPLGHPMHHSHNGHHGHHSHHHHHGHHGHHGHHARDFGYGMDYGMDYGMGYMGAYGLDGGYGMGNYGLGDYADYYSGLGTGGGGFARSMTGGNVLVPLSMLSSSGLASLGNGYNMATVGDNSFAAGVGTSPLLSRRKNI